MSVKKPLAIVATAAMVMTGASFGSAAASAEPVGGPEYVPGAAISTTTSETESAEYNNWHFDPSHGQTVTQQRNGVTVPGTAEVPGSTLIVKGNGNDIAPDTDPTELDVVLEGLSATLSSTDKVTFQVPVRVEVAGEGFNTADGDLWSTLRASVADPTVWTTSKAIGGIGAGQSGTIDQFAGITGIYPIATGLLVQGNTEDVLLSSFTSGGAETKFYAAPVTAGAGDESTEYVDAEGIRPNEAEYAGWHDGVTKTATERNFETVAGKHDATLGLKVSGKSQILNGFADEDFQAGGLAFANGMTIAVAEGSDAVFAQVPVFYYADGQDRKFTTLRAEVTAAGFTADTVWTNSGTVAGIAGNQGTIAEYTAAMGQHDVIGYGFFVDTNKTATVTSISFNGATTNFAQEGAPLEPAVPGEPSTEYVDAENIRPNEADYPGWHDGVTKTATERNFETVAGKHDATLGLKVSGKSQILNGFADEKFQRNALEFATDMTIAVAEGSDAVYAQVPVFYGEDRKFTTLRAEVTPDGFTTETVWTNSGTVAGITGNKGTIAEYIDAIGKHDVIGYGFFVDTNKTATVTSISFNGATTNFAKVASPIEPAKPGKPSTEYVDAKNIRPNEAEYPGWHDGNSMDSTERNFETVAGKNGATTGLKVNGKAQILNGFTDDDFQRNALEFADEMTVTVAAGSDEVYAQVPVFYGKDRKFTTLRAAVPASGKLADVEKWTSSKAISGSNIGANGEATLAEIIDALGNHDVIGYGFFVDTNKTATVTSISFNGATTNFAKAADPVKPEPKPAPFTDITATSKFSKEISWMWNAKISTGNKLPNGTYQYLPKDNVTREAMAAFLFRLYGDKNYQEPAKSPFTDVKKGDKFYKEITWMASAKISTGNKQANGTFKYLPKDNVTREAMAAFLFRADKGATPSKTTKSPFTDMKPGDKFYKEILWMWDAKVSTGNKQANGTYKYIPKDNTSREAMAAFLYRAAPDSKK